MRLFQRKRQTSESQQAQIQAEVLSIHRFYTERVSMPRKLRQYEAKSALMRVDGFTEAKAAETIAKWHAACEQRKRQRLQQQKIARQSMSQVSTRSVHDNRCRPAKAMTDAEAVRMQRIRQAVQEEARTLLALPLEEKLRACDLISLHQLEIARMEQLTRRDGSTAVDILLEKQWIGAETVRFFATGLSQLSQQIHKQPICYYLQLAGLLNAEQVTELHQASHSAGLSVADVAESKGWVKRQTIFFINACLNAMG